jgi:hypothetical protein
MDQKKNPTKDDFEFLQLNGLLPPEMSYEEYCQQELASENPPFAEGRCLAQRNAG